MKTDPNRFQHHLKLILTMALLLRDLKVMIAEKLITGLKHYLKIDCNNGMTFSVAN